MLTYSVLGPYEDGTCLVVYPTPGSAGMTIACPCTSEAQAWKEADRLNAEQLRREKEMRWLFELRGIPSVHPALEGLDSHV